MLPVRVIAFRGAGGAWLGKTFVGSGSRCGEVCAGGTNHAGVVVVVCDALQVTYAALVKVVWANRDPSLGMRQGTDVGTQCRSPIYVTADARGQAAAWITSEPAQ